MKILLTGASGFVGYYLTRTLINQGHTVLACFHKKKIQIGLNSNLQQYQIDYMKMNHCEDWLSYLDDVEIVINAVGIIAETNTQSFEQLHTLSPISLFEACEKVGVKKVIQISALGADDTAITPYHLSKRKADDSLRKLNLDWFILRPSLITGEGGASFSIFQKISNLPIIPLLSNGRQLIQPVEIKEVAAVVLHCLDENVLAKQTIDVVGKEVINYRDWMVSLRSRQYPAKFLSIPSLIMMQVSKLGKLIKLPLLNPDNLIMLQQNNVADRHDMEVFLDKIPVEPLRRIAK